MNPRIGRASLAHFVARIGLVAGPAAALATYLLLPEQYHDASGAPAVFGHAGRATLAMMVWMAVWWLTEAIDIAATALLPLAVFPLIGILPIGRAAAPYASDLVFLFLGGFILALAMSRWGLDRRIALATLRFVGARPRAIVGGFMAVTAALSMWVSNTATAAVMLPIALGVIRRLEADSAGAADRHFALGLMLGIAYAASIGGVATIIGSPPNGIVVQFIAQRGGREIGFAEWLAIGGPVALVLLPVAWLLLTRVLYPPRIAVLPGGRDMFERELAALGPMSRAQWLTLAVFLVTAFAWIARPWLAGIPIGGAYPLAALTDAGIAMLAALALFVIPVETTAAPAPAAGGTGAGTRRVFAMDWATAERLPWGVLVLFGGGLSLAAAVQANGVAEFVASQVGTLTSVPPWLLLIAVTAAVVFLTELTSNTATTATLAPLLAALADGFGMPAELLVIPAAIAASCAFMLPVATPPNAIVFGSGCVTVPDMARAGWWLNIVATALIPAATYLVIAPVLGLEGAR